MEDKTQENIPKNELSNNLNDVQAELGKISEVLTQSQAGINRINETIEKMRGSSSPKIDKVSPDKPSY